MVREGDTYSSYYTPGGETWTLIGRRTLALSPGLPYVGLTAAQDYQEIGVPADFGPFDLARDCLLFLPVARRSDWD